MNNLSTIRRIIRSLIIEAIPVTVSETKVKTKDANYYFDDGNMQNDVYEFKDLGYKATYNIAQDGKSPNHWNIKDIKTNVSIADFWGDGSLEYTNAVGRWFADDKFGFDLDQAVRYVWLMKQRQNPIS